MVFLKHYPVDLSRRTSRSKNQISYSLMGGEERIRALALGLLGLPTPLDLPLLLERHPDIFRMTSFI